MASQHKENFTLTYKTKHRIAHDAKSYDDLIKKLGLFGRVNKMKKRISNIGLLGKPTVVEKFAQILPGILIVQKSAQYKGKSTGK